MRTTRQVGNVGYMRSNAVKLLAWTGVIAALLVLPVSRKLARRERPPVQVEVQDTARVAV